MSLLSCPEQAPTFSSKTPNELTVDCKYYSVAKNEAGYCKRPGYYRCLADACIKIIPLSHSSIQDYLTCHQLYYLKNIRGIRPISSTYGPALKMGALWDRCMQYAFGDLRVNPNQTIEEYEIDEDSVAKVRALYKAYKDLGLVHEPNFQMQPVCNYKFNIYDHEVKEEALVNVIAKYDRKYEDGFVENKLSSRPESYLDIFFMSSQIGTYFMADEKLEWCIMEVVRSPELRVGKNEDAGMFETRIYDDIMARPGRYFIGYDRKTNTYGKKYYRNEFDLVGIKSRYLHIAREIHHCQMFDGWYKNDRACNNMLPGIPCPMLGICRYNIMSEGQYKVESIPASIDPGVAPPPVQQELNV